jgi:hypothetical protein
MFTITSEKIGYGEYENAGDIIEQVRDLGVKATENYRFCACGDYATVVVTEDGDIIAVEEPHDQHQAW